MCAIANQFSPHLRIMKYDAKLLEATSVVIRRLRGGIGISQEELAAKSEVTRSMIDKVERRERLPSLEVLLKLAAAFNTTASQIVELIEKELQK